MKRCTHTLIPSSQSCSTYFLWWLDASGVVWGFEIPAPLPVLSADLPGQIRTILIVQHQLRTSFWSVPDAPAAWALTAHHPRWYVKWGPGGLVGCMVLLYFFIFSVKEKFHFKYNKFGVAMLTLNTQSCANRITKNIYFCQHVIGWLKWTQHSITQ